MTLYEILGVAPDADAGTIKLAWRKLASAHHPDREGGDHARMQAVQQAYDVLSDPERRARYDATGSTKPVPSLEERARAALAQLVNEAIDQGTDLQHSNLLAALRSMLHMHRQNNSAQLDKLQSAIVRRETALARLSGGDGLLGSALRDAITHLGGEVLRVEDLQQLFDAALALLDGYNYRVDEVPPASPTIHVYWNTSEFKFES